MVLLGEARIIELIRTIGLYRNKAKNIIGLSKVLLDKYESKVPKNLELLEQLAGRRTKNSQCCFKYCLWFSYYRSGYTCF